MSNEMDSMDMKPEKKRGLIPKLRFTEFRDAPEWYEEPLGRGISLEYGSSLPEKDRKGGAIPVIGSNGVVGYHDDFIVSGPAIVIGRKGSAGQINWVDSDCYPIDTTFYVKNLCIVDYTMPFLKLVLENSNLERLKDNGAVPGLNRNEVYLLKAPFPKLPEQQKIADCLFSIDELITAQTQKIDTLKDHKGGLLQRLFPAEGETLPKLRFPKFFDAPEWEKKTLECICHMKAGKYVSASDIFEHYEDGLYPCYGGNGLRGYTSSFTHSGTYPLIGRQGALCGNVNLGIGQFHATEHAVVATPIDNVDVEWLFYNLVKLNLNQYATGQAQPGLSVGVLEELYTTIPRDIKEQQKIAICLSSLEEQISTQSEKIDKLNAHKNGLLQQLFPSLDEVQG